MAKWNEETEAQIARLAGNESPVTRTTVESVAEEMDISKRSVSAKLRKMGYTVETAGSTSTKAFTDEEAEQLQQFVVNNSGKFTYDEIAQQMGTSHTARAIQGKILSMELTSHVKAAPPKESVKTYSDEEQEMVVSMVREGNFLEDIATKVGKTEQSVRGKALSLLRAGEIEAMPKQKNKKEAPSDPFDGLDIANMTVEQICEETEKTPRGVKTMLTRRGISASDYDGAKKAAKAAE